MIMITIMVIVDDNKDNNDDFLLMMIIMKQMMMAVMTTVIDDCNYGDWWLTIMITAINDLRLRLRWLMIDNYDYGD